MAFYQKLGYIRCKKLLSWYESLMPLATNFTSIRPFTTLVHFFFLLRPATSSMAFFPFSKSDSPFSAVFGVWSPWRPFPALLVISLPASNPPASRLNSHWFAENRKVNLINWGAGPQCQKRSPHTNIYFIRKALFSLAPLPRGRKTAPRRCADFRRKSSRPAVTRQQNGNDRMQENETSQGQTWWRRTLQFCCDRAATAQKVLVTFIEFIN